MGRSSEARRIPYATRAFWLPAVTAVLGATFLLLWTGDARAGEPSKPVRFTIRFEGEGTPPARVDLVLAPDGRERDEDLLHLTFTPQVREQLAPRAARYVVEALTLDGVATDQWIGRLMTDASGHVEVPVRIPTAISVTVVDAQSGEPLPTAHMRSAFRWHGWQEEGSTPDLEPMQHRPWTADAAGRIELRSAETAVWWVGAPAHAWERVSTSPEQRALRVALGPGGGIRVTVEAPDGLADPRVVVEPGSNRASSFQNQSDVIPTGVPGQFLVEGLPPGAWRVLAGRSSLLTVEEIRAQATVEVAPGRVAEVRLVMAPTAKEGHHDVTGTLSVPKSWDTAPTRIRLQGENPHVFSTLGPTPRSLPSNSTVRREIPIDPAAKGPTWEFHAEDLLDGVYLVTVSPYEWTRYVWLPLQSRGLRLEIPPPVEVRIRLLDASTGLPLAAAEVMGTVPAPDGEPPPGASASYGGLDAHPGGWNGASKYLDRRPDGDEFVRTFPAGRLDLAVKAPGYAPERTTLTLDAAQPVLRTTLRLQSSGEILVRIVRQGVVVESAEGHCSWGKDERSACWSGTYWPIDRGVARLRDLVPGTYVVCWEHWSPSFGTLTRSAVVTAGRTTTIDFELPEK